MELLRTPSSRLLGTVSVNELKAYIEAQAPETTLREKGTAQYPVTYGYGQDFPVAVVQGN